MFLFVKTKFDIFRKIVIHTQFKLLNKLRADIYNFDCYYRLRSGYIFVLMTHQLTIYMPIESHLTVILSSPSIIQELCSNIGTAFSQATIPDDL